MPFSRVATAIAVGAMSLAATAAEPSLKAQPSDPTAQTRPLTFTSAFANSSRAEEPHVSPDKFWRQANANVASEGMGDAMEMGSSVNSSGATPGVADPAGGDKSVGAALPKQANHQMHGMAMEPVRGAGVVLPRERSVEQKGTGK